MKTVYVNKEGVICAVIGEVPKEPNEKDFSGDQWKESNAQKEYQQALQACKDGAVCFEDQEEAHQNIEQRFCIYELKHDTFYQIDCDVDIVDQIHYTFRDAEEKWCDENDHTKKIILPRRKVARIKATPLESKKEMCGHDSCPDDGNCEHCKEPVFESLKEGQTELTRDQFAIGFAKYMQNDAWELDYLKGRTHTHEEQLAWYKELLTRKEL